MKDNKNTVRFLIIFAVSLVVFNLIAFIVPFQRNGSFWVAYGFGMLAIIAQLAVMKLAFSGAETIKSKFYGFPIARIGLIYLAVQLILSFVFMAIGWLVPFWIPFLLCALLAAGAVFGLVAAETVRDEVEKQDVKLARDVSTMRELQSRMNGLVSLAGDNKELRSEIDKLAEDLRYSDPVSNDATREIEGDISDRLDAMKTVLIEGNSDSALSICKSVRSLLTERNRLCKLNKK